MILIPLCCFINHHLLRDPYNRNSLFEKAPAKLKTDTTVCSVCVEQWSFVHIPFYAQSPSKFLQK